MPPAPRTPRRARPHAGGRRGPGVVAGSVAGLVALLLLAACSDTGLSGKVSTTQPQDSSSTPLTTAPLDSSTGGSGSTGGTGGGPGGSSGSSGPQGFVVYQDAATPSSLWRVDADGSNRKQLPAVPGQTLTEPLVSPGGQQLAFLATPVAAPGAPAGPPKLWTASVDGTRPRPLTPDAVADTCYAWAPDGSSLLSATTDPTSGATTARTVALNGSTPPAPIAGPLPTGACPVFLDQQTIAYVDAPAAATPGGPAPRADRIATVRLDGQPSTASVTLTGCALSDLRGLTGRGVVSFAAACDQADQSGIYLVDLKGSTGAPTGQPALVLAGASGPISVSADGGWIAYTRVSDPKDPGTAEILVTRTDGSQARRLVGPTSLAPTWGPPPDGGGGSGSPA